MEIWKDIPEYEGLYQVSSLGRVKSLVRKWRLKEKILKPNTVGEYPLIVLYKKTAQKTITIHQLVAINFLNHIPDGFNLIVDHINTIKTDNRVENLQIVTSRYNLSKDRGGTSKYTGVNWDKSSNKWIAQIRIKSKKKHIGRFECESEASKAYQTELNKVKNGIRS